MDVLTVGSRKAQRTVALGLAACLVLLSPHCGARFVTPETVTIPQRDGLARRAALGPIAIVVAGEAPAVATGGFAAGRCKGASVGAGRAVGGFLSQAFSEGCGGPLACGLLAVVVLALTPVVALGGSIVGAARSVSKKDVRRLRAFLDDAASVSRMRRNLIDGLVADLPDGVDAAVAETVLEAKPRAVLEVELPTISGLGSGGNTPVRWTIEIRARLIRTADDSTLHSASYTYRSCRRRLQEWIRNDQSLLRAELVRATRSLARKIVDEFLLIEPLGQRGPLVDDPATSATKKRKPRMDDPPRVYVGLRPIAPSTLGPAWRVRRNGLPRVAVSRIDSAAPTLRWEAFEPPGVDADRVEDVSYEVRIASSELGLPAEVCYRRNGLREPEHAVEQRLAPGEVYFWTVRARYRLDGRTRVTEWGGIHPRSRLDAQVPGMYSYRFQTGHN